MNGKASGRQPCGWSQPLEAGFLCLAIALAAGSGCGTPPPARPEATQAEPLPRPAATDVPPPDLQRGARRVLQVEDGNTLVLNSGHRIRLLGADAPESRHMELPVQRFGQEAAEFLKSLALGRDCTLKYEGAGFYDDSGRLLAYVYVNGRMLNEEVLRSGYGFVSFQFPFSSEAQFMEIEREARARQLGLWNLSLRDSRIANLVSRYDSLNKNGRTKLDGILEELVLQYPARTNTPPRAVPAAPPKAPPAPAPAPVQAAPEPPKPVPQPGIVPWQDAANHYGKKVVIEGEVSATYRSAAVCFLNFNADYNKDFFAVIPSSAFEQFPPGPETYYKGKRVRITGTVREYRGRPQILLESPKQIEIVE